MRAKVITVSNIKGGVAKTTTAATMAAGLNKKGYKVLLIDADPQSNLTMCFMEEPDDDADTLYTVFEQEKKLKEVKVEIGENFDIIPGDFNLCSADYHYLPEIGFYEYLNECIKEIKRNYDYIVIDTPPNMGFLSMSAFFATDYVITPMSADSFSLKAIRLLKNTLDLVSKKKKKKIPVAGILLTKYDSRVLMSKMLKGSIDDAADLLDTTIFNTKIRPSTVVQQSQLCKINLYDFAPRHSVTKDYENFLLELLSRIE